IYADRDRHFKQLIKEFKTVSDADYEVPKDLGASLRSYQKEGYRWLRTLDHYGFGGILADEMGLGKTLQTIAVLLAVRDEEQTEAEKAELPAASDGTAPSSHTSLVVCPASLVFNWGQELARFAPSLRTVLVAGTQAEREQKIREAGQADVVVTSYDLLKRDIDRYDPIRFRFEIIDEAQYIKNAQTAAAKAVKVVHAHTRFALTGTPIENRLSELWSIFDYLMPGFLYDYPEFREKVELPIVRDGDPAVQERLKRMVAPFVLRRKKEDVLQDLPDKLEEVRYAEMGNRQRRLYDAEVLRMRRSLETKDEADFRRSRIEILAELTRIRQICCDPLLCYSGYDGGSAKREACMQLVESLVDGGHKALLFSQFTSMLELIEQELQARDIPYYKITGATEKKQRLALVNEFNENDVPLFLISLKAGGTGLNLTGADVVIHYDPWWNTAAQDQATDRAHRIGQTKIVTVYKLIVKGTIEEKIQEMQEKKKALADEILSGESMERSEITREDLLAMLDGGQI
ncbi:MAG: DEAD/DEAH box helicase, partial [Lachnospiraceae bacterium]